MMLTGKEMLMGEKTYTQKQVDEIDRSARAYGWEIGNGQSIVAKLNTSKSNPFMDPNWRATHGVDG